jgi:hypothetical protein
MNQIPTAPPKYSQPLTFNVGKDVITYRAGTVRALPRGVAYEIDGFNVCMFAQDTGLRGISPGYAMAEATTEESLRAWAERTFGATNIVPMENQPGRCFRRKWRPGMDGLENVQSHLAPSAHVMTQVGISIELLFERLGEIAAFTEFDSRNLNVFGHRTRELLALACMEVEASLRAVLRATTSASGRDRFTTKDYVRVCDPLCLREFQVGLRRHPTVPPLRPFQSWDPAQPTASLPWYDAYNATKHDRETALDRATLEMCLQAMAAVAVMFCAQFSLPVTADWTHEPAFALNRWFTIELVAPNPSSFYVPPVRVPIGRRADLWLFDGRGTAAWQAEDLVIP